MTGKEFKQKLIEKYQYGREYEEDKIDRLADIIDDTIAINDLVYEWDIDPKTYYSVMNELRAEFDKLCG